MAGEGIRSRALAQSASLVPPGLDSLGNVFALSSCPTVHEVLRNVSLGDPVLPRPTETSDGVRVRVFCLFFLSRARSETAVESGCQVN